MRNPDGAAVAVLPEPGTGRWLRFRGPVRVVEARRLSEVAACVAAIEQSARDGLHVAAFFAYEAAPAFDPALAAHPPGGGPLAWAAAFRRAEPFALPVPPDETPRPDWRPAITRERYLAGWRRIRAGLAAGDTYQVNYTFPLAADFDAPAWPLFLAMQQAQCAPWAAFVETAGFAVCSASPELFFRLADGRLASRPMKGTAARRPSYHDDEEAARALQRSEKNRAENVMIVDMIRNDMGRIARPGSVAVTDLFRVERYPTVHQMTSTVTACTAAGFGDVMRALFPCASITGAPKVHTTQIIREVEPGPRGLYTGAIGHVTPGGAAWFNVAIRTVFVDKARRRAVYGVGGGVVWDSEPEQEYEECLLKARVLTARRPPFELLETLLWEPETGYFLLRRHLERMRNSARYFGYAVDTERIAENLLKRAGGFAAQPHRVRVLAAADGSRRIEPAVFTPAPGRTWRVALAPGPVDASDCFLYHKTTHRTVYETMRNAVPDANDVILWNEAGEVTESSIANVVVQRGGIRYTPPVKCGLLAGVYRDTLVETGEMQERVITRDELRSAEALFLINSVRKWMPAVLEEGRR